MARLADSSGKTSTTASRLLLLGERGACAAAFGGCPVRSQHPAATPTTSSGRTVRAVRAGRLDISVDVPVHGRPPPVT